MVKVVAVVALLVSAAVLPRTGLGDVTRQDAASPRCGGIEAPELAGFTIGQRFDFTNETFCAANKMTGWPAKDLEKYSGFTCRSTVPRDGFDLVQVVVTKKMRVIEIYSSCECGDDAAAKAKKEELKAELLRKYGSRISGNPNYTITVYAVDGYALVIISESDARKAHSADPD